MGEVVARTDAFTDAFNTQSCRTAEQTCNLDQFEARILANMEICAPKLFAIAESISQHAEKAGTKLEHDGDL